MGRDSVEMSVYVTPEQHDDIEANASASDYSNRSEYVRSFLPECSDE